MDHAFEILHFVPTVDAGDGVEGDLLVGADQAGLAFVVHGAAVWAFLASVGLGRLPHF
jgi:hypothetical protein